MASMNLLGFSVPLPFCIPKHGVLVSYIHSAVKDIERYSSLDEVVIGLMHLKSLLLCLEMLGSGVDDRSGLFWGIQDAIRRLNRKQHSLSILGLVRHLHDGYSRIANEVQCMADESKSISSPTVDKVVGIVDSILDNALDFLHLTQSMLHLEIHIASKLLKGEAMNALEVEIKFLKHVLVFATRIGVEQEQLRKVLIRIRPFVINAARIFIHDIPVFTRRKRISAVHSRFPTAAAAIDPGVYQAYAQALSSSTLSKYGHALHLDDFDASRKLNPHLRAVQGLSNAWKDRVTVLCRRRLRGPLKLQKMICDAAIELSPKQSEDDPALLMDEDIFDVLGNFLNSLISMFWDVLRLSDSRKDEEKALYERLRILRKLLKQRPINFDEEEIRHQTGGVICDAAIILFCSLHQTNVGNMSNLGIPDLLHRFDVIQAKANVDANTSQTLQVDSRMDESTNFNFSHGNVNLAASSRNQPLHNYPQVVGFQRDEIDSVLDRLTRGSKQLRIVPIIGMAGLGKTTFALELYNHPSVMYYFQARAWCTVSQVLDKRTVFLQLLHHISELSEHDLADKLRKSLKGKRYLIFLDDVWTPEVWNTLTEAFPDDSTGSRVILTSRHHDIAPRGLIAGEPHLLRPREVKECLEILQAKLFPGKGWPLELNELGRNFAKMCKGLPLTAVIVAGLLVTTEQKGWKQILDSLSSGGLSNEEQCNSALELSFKHLSDDLKLCFLYFGAFPEDAQIAVKLLMRLWMAEGFVQKNDFKRIEDVARENMEKLIERSLVTVAKTRAIGGAKTCRLHDLLHEFCLTKAKQENFIRL